MIREAFGEARRRDPEGRKRWVALVDGNETQLDFLKKFFRKEGCHALFAIGASMSWNAPNAGAPYGQWHSL